MLNQMQALVREKNICVLATDTDGKPYCSLMAYVPDEACSEIYMVTHRVTQKYKNLMQNPAVSLMIDSRESAKRKSIQALTVEGFYYKIENKAKRAEVKEKILKEHPHLLTFANHPDADILRIQVRSFLLLNGLSESHFYQL